jgi:hypothetical protein
MTKRKQKAEFDDSVHRIYEQPHVGHRDDIQIDYVPGFDQRQKFTKSQACIRLEVCIPSYGSCCDAERDHRIGEVSVSAAAFLDGILRVRVGEEALLGDRGNAIRLSPDGLAVQTELEFLGDKAQLEYAWHELQASDHDLNEWHNHLKFGSRDVLQYPVVGTIKTSPDDIRFSFDRLFLDTLSVMENHEPGRRQERDILLSPAEAALLEIVKRHPEELKNIDPRVFEVVVAAQMTASGFSRVRLSRYSKGEGIALWTVYAEGDEEYSVVVQTIRHARNIGIQIVDRLNGVRDRDRASKALLVTTSGITASARDAYQHRSDRMAMVDYKKLVRWLEGRDGWTRTPSELWTRPRKAQGAK